MLYVAPAVVCAQEQPSPRSMSVMAQAIPLLTRATGTANRQRLTEAYLTQPMVMGHASLGLARLVATLNLEGLTLGRGEATTGAWGEGYVDRRHPHAYVHELLLGAEASLGTARTSVFAGRGFVPFGSDEPMERPFVKYPSNHHLAQILERVVAIGALRMGPVGVEAAAFNGDEPLEPAAEPRYSRFGDSWALRGTLFTGDFARVLAGGELTGSFAAVKSPEFQAGQGLDQRKTHAGARVTHAIRDVSAYALVEWARTRELDRGRPFLTLSSLLAEAAVCPRGFMLAARMEQTERPEEERRLGDPFRANRPASDLSIVGVTRWTTFTGALAIPAVRVRVLRLALFVEFSAADVTRATRSLFDPTVFYGAPPLWMLSTGARIQVGRRHDRMGRYGAAGPTVPSTPASATVHSHDDTARGPTANRDQCPR